MNLTPRRRSVLDLVLRLSAAFAAVLALGCTGSRDASSDAGPGRAALVEQTAGRVRVAVERAEQVRADRAAGQDPDTTARREELLARREALVRSIDAIERSPSTDPRRARLEAAQARLRDLTAACEELTLRGSVDAFALDAALHHELDQTRELTRRLGLPPDTILSNIYRLAEVETTRRWRGMWLATKQALQEKQAIAAPGAYVPGLETAGARLHDLDDALSAGPFDLAAVLRRVPESAFAQAGVWLAAEERARAAAVVKREADLLQIALAREPDNLQLLVRLAEIRGVPNMRGAERRAVAFQRFRLFTDPARSAAVRSLVRDRIADPIGAAWRESQLMNDYLAEATTASFPEWIATQLTDGDLVEVASWIEVTRAIVAHNNALAPPMLRQRAVDLEALDQEGSAVIAELQERKRAGLAPNSGSAVEARRASAGALLEVATPTDPGALSVESQRSLWEALERLGARTELASAGRRLRDALALQGYKSEITDLEQDLSELPNLRPTLSIFDQTWRDSSATMAELLWERAKRLRAALSSLRAPDAAEVAALNARLEAVRTGLTLPAADRFVPLFSRIDLLHLRDGQTTPLALPRPVRRPEGETPSWPTWDPRPAAPPDWTRWKKPDAAPASEGESVDVSERLRKAPVRPFGDLALRSARQAFEERAAAARKSLRDKEPWRFPQPRPGERVFEPRVKAPYERPFERKPYERPFERKPYEPRFEPRPRFVP
jgi:hypothetical protein